MRISNPDISLGTCTGLIIDKDCFYNCLREDPYLEDALKAASLSGLNLKYPWEIKGMSKNPFTSFDRRLPEGFGTDMKAGFKKVYPGRVKGMGGNGSGVAAISAAGFYYQAIAYSRCASKCMR